MHKQIKFNNAMIVGGTGMLAKASTYLAQNSNSLIVASRNPYALAAKLQVEALEVDWHNVSEASNILKNTEPRDIVISWVHEQGLKLIQVIENTLKPGGISIRIHGCESADKDVRDQWNMQYRNDINQQTVILGWINQPGGSRWLNHEEISDGVIRAIENPELKNLVVGRLEPKRPLF